MKLGSSLPLFVAVAVRGPFLNAQPVGTFTPTGSMITPRFLHTATLLPDGRVLIAGGSRLEANYAWETLSSAEIYDPNTGTFTPTGNMSTPRAEHTATLLPNGKVLIAGGGIYSGGPALTSADLYDPDTGTFTATGDMTMARVSSTATLLNDGNVLIAGGNILASAELYDPSTGTFTATGNMTLPFADTATLLPNGMVLITRGNPDGQPPPFLSSADLFDPSTGTFTFGGYLNKNHTGPTANLLANGEVLIAGGDYGDGDGGSVFAELYDPTTGLFSNSENMTVGREQDTATLLPDATVLFAGGHNVNLAATAEIYDPVQNAFSRTASMPTVRELQTATLLMDGRVLIAGGDDERFWIPETILSSAERYTPSVLVPAPMLFSLAGNGQGQGAIWHAGTGQIASSANSTTAGDILSMYTTHLFEGGLIPPQVTIGGQIAELLYFGDAPGYPGYNQVNFRVPSGVVPGPAVSVRLTYIGRSSNTVTIGLH